MKLRKSLTLEYIIQNRRKELMELLKNLQEEATNQYIDAFPNIEELIGTFLTNEYLEGKHILPVIDKLI